MSQKIVNWPSRFVPANGRTVSLSDVKFKDTAILFIQTNTGEELRLEAEIDRFYEQEHSEFQAGSVRLFVKEKTHKSLNVTFVDVERYVAETVDLEVLLTDYRPENWIGNWRSLQTVSDLKYRSNCTILSRSLSRSTPKSLRTATAWSTQN